MSRIHVVALPHSNLTKSFEWCAYTAKVWRFIKMLRMSGHDAIVYASDVRDADVELNSFEYVPVATSKDRERWFGTTEWSNLTAFDYWSPRDIIWKEFNKFVSNEVRTRWQQNDILGIIAGNCQQDLVTQLSDLSPLVCEWGTGYSGVLTNSHKVFESYAWAHHVAGLNRHDDIDCFDTVIPNCFDIDDLIFSPNQGDYLLYLGRSIPRKGLRTVSEIAKRVSIPVKTAGQPGEPIPFTEHVGIVTGQKKAELLAGALAILVPTNYLEPFGGVAVEAMLSGTPVIATDWGAFTETVTPGITGYRCRVLSEFLNAVDMVKDLDRSVIRQHAILRYTLDVGSQLYNEYIRKLTTLFSDGWYDLT